MSASVDTRETKRSSVRHGARRGVVVPLIPIALFLAMFYLYPTARMLYLSFGGSQPTLDHFRQFFVSDLYVDVLSFTLVTSLAVCVLCLLLAYPIAYALATTSPRVRAVLFVVVLVPWLLPELVRNFTWLVILQSNGVVAKLQEAVGFGADPVIELGTVTAVIVGMVYVQLPLAVLPMYAVMQRLDFSLMAVASSLGARPHRVITEILFPLTMPGVATSAVLVFLTTLGFFITPLILGGGQHPFMANIIDIQVSRILNWELGSALSVILVVAGLGGMALASRLIGWRWLLGDVR
jgi:ABC-type spermidine/putrescine transport system permease subunit I